MAPLSTRKKWIFSIILTLLIIVFLAAAAETAVRVRQHFKYGTAQRMDNIFVVATELGQRILIPGRYGPITINKLGFRGEEIESVKPAGALRLAFLGASTTFCAEVSSDAATWPYRVAQSITGSLPGRQVDYVNAGVPGYTLSNMDRMLEERVAPLKPDVIVIYEATNTLSGETRDMAANQGLQAMAVPNEPDNWLARYSLLWFLVEKNLRLMQIKDTVARGDQRLQFDPQDLGKSFRSELYKLVRDAQAVAPIVAVVTFTYQMRREQTPEQKLAAAQSALYYQPYMTPDGLIAAFERYNHIIREVAAETGAVLIDGEYDIPGDSTYFHDSVHFTDAGAAKMAERVTRSLLEVVTK